MASEFNEELGIDLKFNNADNFRKSLSSIGSGVSALSKQFEFLSNNIGAISSKLTNAQKEFYKLGQLTPKTIGVQAAAQKQLYSGAKSATTTAVKMGLPQYENVRTAQLLNSEISKIADKQIRLTSLKSSELQLEKLNLAQKIQTNSALLKDTQYMAQKKVLAKQQLELNKQNTIESNKANKNLFAGLKALALKILSLRTAFRFVSQTIAESANYVENLNLFAVTFGKNYKEVLGWSQEFADNLGVSYNAMVKTVGLFKQLSTSIGIADTTGDKLAKTLSQLAYDFSSFYNIQNVADVVAKIQSGIFSGQVRTLRTMGIDVSMESVDTLLKTNETLKQINVTARQLNQTQKVLARTILTMEAGKNAFGDMAKTITTLQNRIRVLKSSFENLKLAIGDAFNEPARQALGYLIGFVQALTAISRAFIPTNTAVQESITLMKELGAETEDAGDSIGQLSFDKMEALNSGDNENLSVTEALTTELENQISLYDQIVEQYSGIDKKVQSIKNSIILWAFPLSYIDETTGKIVVDISKYGKIIETIIVLAKNLFSVISKLYGISLKIAPELFKVVSAILNVVNSIVTWLDKLDLIEPVIWAIVAVMGTLAVAQLAVALTNPFTYILLSIMAVISAVVFLINLFKKVDIKVPSFENSVNTISPWEEDKPWGIDFKKATGYATGGIPSEGELFRMNEGGVPETLFKGNSGTNVINIEQLSFGMKKGFMEAIYETGLLNSMKNNVVIEGKGIDGLIKEIRIENRRQNNPLGRGI